VQNFFKHADRDPDAEIEFFPEMTEPFIADACKTYMEMTSEVVPIFQCFMWWFKSREGEDGFDCPNESRELLQDLLALFTRGDRAGFLMKCMAGQDRNKFR
jgi:hypothetical protein